MSDLDGIWGVIVVAGLLVVIYWQILNIRAQREYKRMQAQHREQYEAIKREMQNM